MWTVRLMDGSLVSGSTASDILAEMKALMWSEPENIKASIAYRAWTLSRIFIDEDLPDDEFVRTCAAAGLLAIVEST